MMKHLLPYLLIACFLLPVSVKSQSSAADAGDLGFFPIGVWLQSPSNASKYKANGINMFVGVHQGLTLDKLNSFKAAGMRFICSQNDFALGHLDEPLIYAWMHGDEPDNAQWNSTTGRYDPCINPEIIINDYEKMKDLDSTRQIYLNLGRGVAYTKWVGRGTCTGDTNMYKVSNDGYLKGCDIASFDIYPVNSKENDVKNNLWYVALGIDNLERWSDYKKPVWCWIETTRISEDSERKPTPAEVKSEVWMAITHGATGFGYFCHSFYPSFKEAALLQDSEMINAVKKINAQVKSLAPVLNSPDTAGIATVTSSKFFVPVHIMTKHHDSISYIFAVAMRPGQTEATFTVKEGEVVEVLGENRTIQVTDGKFTDDFSDYGVHIYKYGGPATNVDKPESQFMSDPKIFPNPTLGDLHIEFPGVFTGRITISDITGKRILEKNISAQKCSFDLSDARGGMYFIRMEGDKNFWHKVIRF
jgi:hypothetical protein